MSKLSIEQIKDVQLSIISAIKASLKDFEQIRALASPVINQWQAFIGLMLPIQQKAIQLYSFSGDQQGLTAFNHLLAKHLDNPEVRQLNQEKWDIALSAAFGIKKDKNINLSEAQMIICEIADTLTSNDSLAKFDKLSLQFDESLSMVEKRQRALEIILPMQMNVFSKYGFEGQQGYLIAQACLVEHYHDPIISAKANEAMSLIFSKLGLIN